MPHALHIRTLYIWGGSPGTGNSEAREECHIKLLQGCVNLTALGIYFNAAHSSRQCIKLQNMVLSLIIKGQLASLGLYTYNVYPNDYISHCEHNAHSILQAIAGSETARFGLKSLYLCVHSALPETQALIQTRFPNLQTLEFERSFERQIYRHEADKWKGLGSLTRLHFHDCSGITASDIPILVALFPVLKELLVTDLPYPKSEHFRERYPVGWHLVPNALCNLHQRLESIFIDNSDTEQIKFIGVIPTRMLTIKTRLLDSLLSALKEDVNLFPGIKLLLHRHQDTRDGTYDGHFLNKWCTIRNVEVVKWEPKQRNTLGHKYRV
jgi:hypothetical protein